MSDDRRSSAGPLLLVGCGKMGGALLGGWLARGVSAADVVVVEPALDPSRTEIPDGVSVSADVAQVPADFAPRVVIFAVKPQVMAEVVPAYARYAGPDTVFLSIAAGTPIRYFEGELGADAAVVRVMPNTPAAVRRGMSVLCANPNVNPDQRAACADLLAAVGEIAWLEDEDLMDAVTAVSGSGPAYVFLLIECLARAGEEVGLSADLAAQLALQTVAGAGELARLADEDPAQLRINVSSPGGTTLAALEVLMAEAGLQPLMTAAVRAAERRGRELGA
ncbi:MAG: pyrroline-5-carboxylate reductase [Alphaproteobacteria bacterium]|jgi:pyrroline-5-carboxylate reductase|nr:pyrroline-5-carboxylate reductase [Alphaproteobacteria bacterium]MDP6563209.1 pyrroline-5-carboxylate reductase [Alphaproteobacteria bacterium]MDP6814780.1 pyrroline-5-carboxylate reductase [Alphaproteobacteria bacterium]